MPVKGRKPKPQGQQRHRHKPTHDWIEVLDQPYEGEVPALPRRRGGWPSRVRKKWQAWSRMPHCALWDTTDWEFALDSLELAAQFYEGNVRLATELRNRERVLGTTADFRRDLRIRYVDQVTDRSEEPTTGNVANINDYRDLSG